MREFADEFMDEFFANFVREFKYEIRTNSREFVRIRMNFLHEKLVRLRMACTVYTQTFFFKKLVLNSLPDYNRNIIPYYIRNTIGYCFHNNTEQEKT